MPGLGHEFRDEVRRTLTPLSTSPELGAAHRRQTRRMLVRRFPFSIIYREEPSGIPIVAAADQRRRPGYWKRRV